MNVLFVCVRNAGRSVASERLFRAAVRGRHDARSAGSHPAAHIQPEVAAALAEVGIDTADHVPHELERADAQWADVVVTMGCGDACPYVPGRRYVDWQLDDPAGKPLEEVRRIRDEIAALVRALVVELDGAAVAQRQGP